MKYLRIGFILSLLLTLIFFNSNCSDNDFNQNFNSSEPIQTDGPGEKVDIFVQEYVQIIPQFAPSYYSWYQIGYFACNSNCFTTPYPSMVNDSFTVPDSIRTVDGDQFISQGQHRFVYGGAWDCRPNNWALLFHVTRNLNTYLYVGHLMSGSNSCSSNPNLRTGNYQNTSASINSIYSNLSYNINYGITTVGGEDE